ncbi:MAG: class I SAM-dependent methyltransferase [Dermatophilaceae bacterium]
MFESTTPAQVASPPGGRALALGKVLAERVLWSRVALGRRGAARRGLVRPLLTSVASTAVLQDDTDWRAAVAEVRSAGLPLHHDRPKNWDAAGAVGSVLGLAAERGREIAVLDAGAARYSSVLPWLRLYGLGGRPGGLRGINLEFARPVSRDGVTFEHGDVTDTGYPDRSIDAMTCMSVIEHGVPLRGFLTEAARLLTPGGLLCVSTDYDQDPPDTSGVTAYGAPVRIFGPDDIHAFVADAAAQGLDLVGDLSAPGALAHRRRPVHWRRTGLDYTFILMTFRRAG